MSINPKNATKVEAESNFPSRTSIRWLSRLCLFFMIFLSACFSPCEDNFVEFGARFKSIFTYQNYIYEVDARSVTTYDSSQPDNPVEVQRTVLASEVQNASLSDQFFAFTFSNELHIFQIGTNGIPTTKSITSLAAFEKEIDACDQLLVWDGFLYVSPQTAERANICIGSQDSTVRVYDMADPLRPMLAESKILSEPGDIMIDEALLFVADGLQGIKVYDRTDPRNLNFIADIREQIVVSLKATGGVLTVLGRDDLRTYDYSDPSNISLISILLL